MSMLIPGKTGLDRAKYTIKTIDRYLPSPGDIRRPSGTRSKKLRWALRHEDLRPITRPGQHPRVAAAFSCSKVPRHTYQGRFSYQGDHVGAFFTQVLVPVLGTALGLTYLDRNNDPVTYVATVEEVEALATEIRRIWPS